MRPLPPAHPVAPAPRDPRIELRRLARELEGVFLGQLFQAMRASVPADPTVEDAGGRDLYQSLLDDQLAARAAQRSQRGIGEALYRQLCRRLAAGEAPPSGGPPPRP